jgi:hypothetical protein
MLFTTNSSNNTQPLNSASARILKSCDSISYSQDSGWTQAIGKDKDKNIVIAVHGHCKEDFDQHLNRDKSNLLGFNQNAKTTKKVSKPKIKFHGYILAIKDCSDNLILSEIENSNGSREPELFATVSEARKEKRELHEEMGYVNKDMFTAPASYNEHTKKLVIHTRNPKVKTPQAVIDYNQEQQPSFTMMFIAKNSSQITARCIQNTENEAKGTLVQAVYYNNQWHVDSKRHQDSEPVTIELSDTYFLNHFDIVDCLDIYGNIVLSNEES